MFALLYPGVPVQFINAGISGDNAPSGLQRLERDVLAYYTNSKFFSSISLYTIPIFTLDYKIFLMYYNRYLYIDRRFNNYVMFSL